jgi:hypothetical protein
MGSPAANFPLRGVYEGKNENHFNITKAFVNTKSSPIQNIFSIIFITGKYFKHIHSCLQFYIVALKYFIFQVPELND